MASTYVNDLRLEEMATGDQSGSWGTTTNTNLELIAEALGYGTEGITTNADTHTTTVADGATDPGRSMYIEYTGTLDSACTITIAPNTVNRMHFIENGTSGSQNIIIKQGSGATITIPPGDVKAVYLDGAGSGAKVVDAFASLNVVDLKVQDDLTVTDDLIVNGDIDLEGSIDVNGTANLDVVDIDGAVDMASTLQVDGAITSSAGATITTADNLTQLTLVSTDADASPGPILDLYRNSSSPADADSTGRINFQGENSAGETITYSQIFSSILDVTDGTEDGRYKIGTMVAGSFDSRLDMTNTETVFNEDSKDLDFRVESNGNANMLFVDGGEDRIGIGTSSPAKLVHIVGVADNGLLEGLQIDNTDHASGETGQAVAINLRLSKAGTMRDAGRITIGKDDDWDDNAATDSHMTFKTMLSNTLTEHMRIDSSGRVGIGETSPANLLHVKASDVSAAPIDTALMVLEKSGTNYLSFMGANTNTQGVLFGDADDNDVGQLIYNHSSNHMAFSTAAAERMRIDSSGRLGIGTTSPGTFIHIKTTSPSISFTDTNSFSDTEDRFQIRANADVGQFQWFDNSTSATTTLMTLTDSGNVGIGLSSGIDEKLHIKNGALKIEHDSHPVIYLEDVGNSTSQIGVSGQGAGTDNIYIAGFNAIANSTNDLHITGANGRISTRENLVVGGALSKASGSFRIDHPLESKKDTHHLVHSFVEAPQADNIYRGTVTLSSGTATVNLDTVAGMTEGTYVLLNTNSSCFTSNETDWDAVKGSVSGNVLTINCQNDSSTATVSWLVIGERQDQHMKDTDWTDADGKVIVEPLKGETE